MRISDWSSDVCSSDLGRGRQDDRIFALWFEPGEADVYLWAAQFRSDHPYAVIRLWLDTVGLAAVPILAERGNGDNAAHAQARARQSDHDFRQPLQAQGRSVRNARKGCGARLSHDEDRREISRQAQRKSVG